MKKKDANYSIGIDIGTNSVGWAVVDDEFNLIKKGNKNLWGSRLFDAADTAASRRISRSTRRRYNKRRERIRLLQECLVNTIEEVDSTFLFRLGNTSFLDSEDKQIALGDKFRKNHILFTDDNYTDKDFHKQYKTIYHLRHTLCTSTKKEDIRHIYLALHHMVKYRGNFLNEGEDYAVVDNNVDSLLENAITTINDSLKSTIEVSDYQAIFDVFYKAESIKLRHDEIMKLISFPKEHKAIVSSFFKALMGAKFEVGKLVSIKDIEVKLQFKSGDYAEKFDEAQDAIGEYVELIDTMYQVYSHIQLAKVLGKDNEDMLISSAMIKKYDNHKDDLLLLKSLYRDKLPDKYNNMFRKGSKKRANYYSFINYPDSTKYEQLYDTLKKELKGIVDKRADDILQKVENENFLLKQNDTTNVVVPYQLQKREMEMILNNQAKYYPELSKNKDKILSILTFRIPYYYGPLDGNEEFGWLTKQKGKENERILPWNHESVVDVEATANEFIKKLTNYCTYLPTEQVMPKASLTCERFELLNELNKIRIDGKFMKHDIKVDIINGLFLKQNTVKESALIKFLKKRQYIAMDANPQITGYQKDKEFSSSLSTWIKMMNIFGQINSNNIDVIEAIIYDLTVFNDIKILKKRLPRYKIVGESNKILESLLKCNFSGWSRLSKRFISGIYANNKFGTSVSILDTLEYSNLNLMEIINDEKLGYVKVLEILQKTEDKISIDEAVSKLAGSPALKKGILQAMKIIDEIKSYMKNNPTKVYLEFAREEGTKRRSVSQIAVIQKLYQEESVGLLYKELVNEDFRKSKMYSEIKNGNANSSFNQQRLYLYYTQLGQCMYTGKKLDIDNLSNYHIDHIIPQSLIKDDSIDNKVLVYSETNTAKGDDLVLPPNVRNRREYIWKKMFECKLISPKKYFSLIRDSYSDQAKEKFIARQLVETRQIIKHVANLIKNHYENTEVVTIRANLASDFRGKYDIVKNRNVNDFHHAHDAYIACVLGTYISKRYPNLDAKFAYGEYVKYIRKSDHKKDNHGFIINSMNYPFYNEDTNKLVWDETVLHKVLKKFSYKDYFVTKKLEVNDKELFKQTINPNRANSDTPNKKLVPVNKCRSDTTKYGGYGDFQYAMYAIEGIDIKGKTQVRKISGLPLIYKNSSTADKEQYFMESEKLQKVTILCEVYKNQLVEIEGGLFFITSPTELVNAKQLLLTNTQNKVVHAINKYNATKLPTEKELQEIDDLYQVLITKMYAHYPKYKNIANRIKDKHEDFNKLDYGFKCKVIQGILTTLSAGPANGNLNIESYKLGDRAGRLNGKNIKLDDTIFITQSITGMYSKREVK